MIIERPKETEKINSMRKWVLVYGRRKTGKTFLVTNFIKHDEYFFIKSDRNVIAKDDRPVSYETFIEIVKRVLEANGTVVVDEFHRLGQDFFEFLHYTKKKGRLILISSTLFLSKRLVSSRSPLLGFFAEVPIGLIRLEDCLDALKGFRLSKKEKLELAILLKEPLAVDYFDERKKARELIAAIVMSSMKTIPALVGEIFLEEEREISAVYEGILRAVAIGKVGSGEISSYLFSKKLLKKDDPSVIQQYLNNLVSFGIIKKIGVFNKKKFVYKLCSPLLRVYYYSDEKYNLSERKVAEKELALIVDELVPRAVEDSVREFLAEKYGLRETVVEIRDFEVDGCLLKFKKPEIALEVKWKKLAKSDILGSEENLGKINAPRKVLFVQDKNNVDSSLQVIDVEDFEK